MKVLLNLCLLLSLISPVVLLTCKKCLSVKGTKCSKPVNENCTSDSSCKNYIFNSNVLDMRIARKSCTDSTKCDPGEYSLTTSGGGFMKLLVDCCTKYNCNKKPLQFSSEPMEPNGLECEGCYTSAEQTCEGVEMVKCLGDQTKCISMKINYVGLGMRGRNFITKGCATPLMCDESKVKNNMDLGLAGVNSIIVNCTDVVLSTEPSSLA